VPSPQLESELLLAWVMGYGRTELFLNARATICLREAEKFQGLLYQRCLGRPLQQLTGQAECYGINLKVTPDVLIPRPETEILVDHLIKNRQQHWQAALDIGTGSGAIAIALAQNIPGLAVTATDICPRALKVARENIFRHGVGDRVEAVQADLFPNDGTAFDLIVSNPPYIPTDEIDGLQPEVAVYEPKLALDGGRDGLDFYRRISAGCGPRLRRSGTVAVEVGQGQAAAVVRIFTGAMPGFQAAIVNDLAGIERIVLGQIC
jgi:release factor glutamine methyltransferase